MAQTKPKAGQFYGVSDNGTDGQFLKTDGTGGMSWDSPITNPTITSIDYPGSATAADPAGGESVIINGTLFASGITCTVGGTSAVTAFNSANQITITTPAKAAGQYTVAVTNPDGGTVSQANFIQYSGVPVWSTASGSLGSVQDGATASFQVTATEGSDTIEYAVTTGSLPSGLSLNTNTGAITGTAPSVSSSTTTTFSITATDDENQTSSARSFNITVTPDLPSNYFSVITYTGTGATQSTNSLSNQSGTINFKPDLVWIKQRNSSARNHNLTDIVRGAGNNLASDTNAQAYQSGQGFSSFDSSGFTLNNSGSGGGGGNTNISGVNHVAWCFKAGGEPTATNIDPAGGVPTNGSVMIDGVVSTAALAGDIPIKKMSVNNTLGFSMVNFAGTYPSTGYVPHGLSVAPELVILKTLDMSASWLLLDVANQTGGYLNLTDSFAASRYSAWLWSKNPNSTTVPLNAYNYVNGTNMLMYSFVSKPGFSKVGSYTGNNGQQAVQTGFEPAFLLIKNKSSTNNWIIVDNKRSPENQRKQVLDANLADAETTETVNINFLTNGFQLTNGNSNVNDGSGTYLYVAFAADPSTTTPSLANSFNTTLYNGSSSTPLSVNGVGFKADFSWLKIRNNSYSHGLFSSLMPFGVNNGVKNVYSNNTDAATDLWGTLTWNNTGFVLNGGSYDGSSAHDFGASGGNFVSWNWKAGGLGSINTDGTITSIVSANQAAGFSVVSYTANATSGATIGHNLGGEPDMVIVKSTNLTTQSWNTYIKDITDTNAKYLMLNSDSAISSTANPRFIPGNFSSTVFSVGNDNSTNGISGTDKYIAYCFTSISGYSKVGSYTGTGVLNTIATGFEPSWVIIKRTNNTGGWLMFDNKRNTSNPRNSRIEANNNQAEQTGSTSKFVNFNSTNLQIGGNNGELNASGDTYMYLAIKEN